MQMLLRDILTMCRIAALNWCEQYSLCGWYIVHTCNYVLIGPDWVMSIRNVLSQFYSLYSFLPTIYIKLRSINTVFNNLSRKSFLSISPPKLWDPDVHYFCLIESVDSMLCQIGEVNLLTL
jgi:hypothetical protein